MTQWVQIVNWFREKGTKGVFDPMGCMRENVSRAYDKLTRKGGKRF